MLAQLINSQVRMQEQKESLLADSARLDRLVAAAAQQWYPKVARPEFGKYATKIDALEAATPEDHPMVGYATELRDRVHSALQDPRFNALDANTIMSALLNQPPENQRLLASYQAKRVHDTGFFSGEKYRDIPGYDQWHQAMREAEAQEAENRPFWDTERTLTSAGLGATTGFVSGRLAAAGVGAASLGAVGLASGGPVGGLIGAGVGALGGLISPAGGLAGAGLGAVGFAATDAVGQLAEKVWKDSDWYQARIQDPSFLQSGKTIALDMAPMAIAGVASMRAMEGNIARQLAKGNNKVLGFSKEFWTKDKLVKSQMYQHEARLAAERVAQRVDANVGPDAEDALAREVAGGLAKDSRRSTIMSRARERFAKKERAAEAAAQRERTAELAAQRQKANDPFGNKPTRYKSFTSSENEFASLPSYWQANVARWQANESHISLEHHIRIAIRQHQEFMRNTTAFRRQDFVRSQQRPVRTPREVSPDAASLRSGGISEHDLGSVANQSVNNRIRDTQAGMPRPPSGVTTHEPPSQFENIRRLAEQAAQNRTLPTPTPEPVLGTRHHETERAITQRQINAAADALGDTQIENVKKWQEGLFAKDPDGKYRIMKEGGLRSFLEESPDKQIAENAEEIAEQLAGKKSVAMSDINRIAKNLSPLITLGILGGTMAITLGSPDTADASVVSVAKSVWQATANAAKTEAAIGKNIVELFKKGKLAIPYAPGSFKIPYVMSGKPLTKEGISKLDKNLLSTLNAKNINKNPAALAVSSPGTKVSFWYHDTSTLRADLGSLTHALYNNQTVMTKYIDDVFKNKLNISTKQLALAQKETIEVMEPLAVRGNPIMQTLGAVHEAIFAKRNAIDAAKKHLNARRNRPTAEKAAELKANIAKYEQEVDDLIKKQNALLPEYKILLDDADKAYKHLAAKHPTVRMFLAAEDTVDHKYYPWLKGMLKDNDRVGAADIRALMDNYADRMTEIGEATITHRPFMHHVLHPKQRAELDRAFIERLGLGEVVAAHPYSSFHRRALWSIPMVPEASYALKAYVPDAERRILWGQFWGKYDKGNTNTWWRHRNSWTVRSSPGLNNLWNEIERSSVPPPPTFINRTANLYSAFEVIRLIGWTVSTPFKHFFKNMGTASTLGIRETAGHYGPSAKTAIKNWTRRNYSKSAIEELALGRGDVQSALDEMAQTFTMTSKYMNYLDDMQFSFGNQSKVEKFVQWVATKSGFMTRMVEDFDRTHSLLASMDMAAHRGMTAEQALTGIYETTIKNNFMSGPLNPAWARNPKFRALSLFQVTPFKIWDRRIMTMYKASDSFRQAGKLLKAAFQNSPFTKKVSKEYPNYTLGQLASDMLELRKTMTDAQHDFHANLFYQALTKEKDFFGTPYTKQLMTELLLGTLILGGGAYFGRDFWGHVGHFPFISAHSHGAGPEFATSPIVGATYQTFLRDRPESRKDEFVGAYFLNKWLGTQGPIPSALWKTWRITNDDIPAVYNNSPVSYFLTIPHKGAH